ncbi:MAG: SDR family NAD(P)-dependent oxidoreductase [Bdellovibrionota bacterium]
MQTGLNEKVVLVTGASGGIGSEVARQFAKEGARVVIHYHQNVRGARNLNVEIGESRSYLAQADLSQEGDVARLFETIEKDLGPVDVVVANAGKYTPATPLHELSLEQWNQTLSANLTSQFLTLREFFRGIKRHGLVAPSAVLIGSTAGKFGEAAHADYASAKGAVMNGFLKTLKNEISRLAPKGRVNAVCPGWTLTPMVRDFAKDPAAKVRVAQTIPMKKIARPEDVASSVLFLASESLSGHLSGECIFVSGGMEGRVLYAPEEVDANEV